MAEEKERDEANEPFKVVDHRRFNPDGTEKPGDRSPISEGPEKKVEEKRSSSPRPEETQQESPVNFAGFILSLAGSAQMSLGLSPNPMTQKMEKDLKQAKQMIDILGVISDKTKGNLTPEESQLLEVILADLRLRFVEENKKI